jgi:hypothetical protein
MRLLAICMLAVSALADDPPDLSRIVGRAVAVLDMNWEDSLAYTWKEKRSSEMSTTGRPTRRHSMTYEVVLLEGLHFFKLIEKEGQPLSGFEQKQQLERMRDEAEKRRNPNFRPPEKHPLARFLPYSRLADDFDLKLAVEDERRWTITGRPKYQGRNPPAPDAFAATEFRMEVDRAESQIARLEFKYDFRNLRDTTIVMVRQKAVDHIWMWTLVQNIPPPISPSPRRPSNNSPMPPLPTPVKLPIPRFPMPPSPSFPPIQTSWLIEYAFSHFRKL